MKDVRKAIKAAMKEPALIKRATKDAAESFMRGMAYREADKMREEMEATEKEAEAETDNDADSTAEVATNSKRNAEKNTSVPRNPSPSSSPGRTVSPAASTGNMSPSQLAGAARRR